MADFAVPDGFVTSANPVQLHDEARGTLTKWPASFSYVGDRWVYRVERDDLDEAAEARVEGAIANHAPNPDYGVPADWKRLRELAAKASLTTAEVAEAVRLMLKRLVS